MTVYVEQLSLLNAVCLRTTDGEVKHDMNVGNDSSGNSQRVRLSLTCYLWMEMLMLL